MFVIMDRKTGRYVAGRYVAVLSLGVSLSLKPHGAELKVKVTLVRSRRPRGVSVLELYFFFNLGARWEDGWSTPRSDRFTPE